MSRIGVISRIGTLGILEDIAEVCTLLITFMVKAHS